MNRYLKIASKVAMNSMTASSIAFKDLPVGGTFHDGTGKGMGMLRDEVRVTYYKKVDLSSAEVIKCDWAPRQVGGVDRMGSNKRVWVVDEIPDYDTRSKQAMEDDNPLVDKLSIVSRAIDLGKRTYLNALRDADYKLANALQGELHLFSEMVRKSGWQDTNYTSPWKRVSDKDAMKLISMANNVINAIKRITKE